MKIAIIGGGIGGLALANCFQKFNIPYTLYEKADSFGEVGAGIGISESTFSILENLGMGERIKQKGNFVKDVFIANKKAGLIRKLPVTNGGFCIHRADLIDILSENMIKDRVKFGVEVTGFESSVDLINLHFKNGQSQTYNYVFACDGINSVFRQQLFPEIKKRYSGQTVWRGISTCQVSDFYRKGYVEFWGENLRFATIPLNNNNLYYWYACKVAEEGEQDDKIHIKEDLKTLFRDYNEDIKTVINNTSQILRNDMWDIKPHNKSWHKDHVIFLGDAIHATTPNLAQGACQAIEDAYTIAMLISKMGFSDTTFDEYRNLRIQKVNYIVKQSRKYGKMSHQRNKLLEIIIQNLIRFLPDRVFQNQYDKLIDIDYLQLRL